MTINERPSIYDFWGKKTQYGCQKCSSETKESCTCFKKETYGQSCGCKLELSVECIRWTNEPTNLYKTGENLQNILKKIEELLGEGTQDIIFTNLGNGQAVYKGFNQGAYEFKTLSANQGVVLSATGEMLNFSLDIDYVIDNLPPLQNLQQVTDVGNITNQGIIIDEKTLQFKPLSTPISIQSDQYANFWYGINNNEDEEWQAVGYNFSNLGSNETIHTFTFADNKHQSYLFPDADFNNTVAYQSYVDDSISNIPIYDLQQVLEAGSIANVSTNLEIQSPNINIGTSGSSLKLYNAGTLELHEGSYLKAGNDYKGNSRQGLEIQGTGGNIINLEDNLDGGLINIETVLHSIKLDKEGLYVNPKLSDGYILPIVRGTNNQILQTDDTGNVTWVTPQTVDLSNYYTILQINNLLNLKLDKPTTTGDTTTHPFVVLENGSGGSARFPAGDLGKNLANSDLTQTAPRVFETLGQALSFRTLPDMRNNTAFVNFLGQNSTGQLARIGYQAFKAEAESWTSAQRLEYGQIMNDGTGSTGAMSVNLISPPIIQNTFDSDEYILLRGANLNLSAITRKIEIINATTSIVVATIPDSQIQVYASGIELIFYYNFLGFPIGDYRIRITSGIRVYTTTLNLSVVAEVENIDTSNLNWDIVYDGGVTPNLSDLAFGASFQITTPVGIGSVPKISVKSDELFAIGENFYLEMSIDLGSKGSGAVTDMNISKLGIGYSSSVNNLAFNTLVNYGYSWHFNTEIRNYNNNTVLSGSVTTPTNQTVIFIKTGNLFRTIVGNTNQSQTLSNNSGYSIFLNFLGRAATQVIQGQIIKAFKFN